MKYMALEKYRKKRNFKKTPEPKKTTLKKGKIFVVQEHYARRHHYDFRIKIGNVLKSWAVPKEPPLKEGERRLAVETEDHPLDYAKFEGVIPEGNYGAGKVFIWDNGEYENLKKEAMIKTFENGKIEIMVHGKKLNGPYALIKTKFDKKSWLLIRMKNDKFERD